MGGMYDAEERINYKYEFSDYPETCKFCGEKNLAWIEPEEEKWRLHDKEGKLHECWIKEEQ